MNTFDADYGPPTMHALDPRNEPDDREWPELTAREQKERAEAMSHAELVELTLELLFDIDAWRGRYGRLCIRQGIENIYRERA